MEDAGKDAEKLLAAGFGKPALWVHLPDGKALLDRFKGTPAAAALPKITRATVNVSFAKDANINARIDVPVGREATGVFRQIEVGLEMAVTAAEQAEKRMAAGALSGNEPILMGRLLKNVGLDETDDGKAVLVTWKPGDLTFDAILKILDGG